ncbi:MAG: hypothetical protein ABL953_13625 [Ilumatobacteraceae bacterium]
MSAIRSKFAPIVVCLAFGLAACGDDSKSSDDTVTTVADTTGATDTTAPETSATDAPETSATDATDTSVDHSGDESDDVMLADSSLGQILVDANGMTLYLFANDPVDTATCTGGCAGAWPPFLADDDHIHAGEGLDDDLFTLVAGEGGQQWSFNGHPLYYYASDAAPGDVTGQGVGGVWFVLDADGNAIT